MPLAILIGFEYTFNSLTGATIDLYHATNWCQSFGCDIHILTDIETVKDENNLQQAIDRRIAEPDLLTFTKQSPFSKRTVITNKNSLLESISHILQGNSKFLNSSKPIKQKAQISDNKIVIYYSGHGVKDSMVMPNRTLLSFVDFRDNILNVLDPYVELFWILDCCNPNGLHLPYKLEGNTFVLSPTKIECVLQPILLITSSEAKEKSIATKSGSVFSRHLFKILTQLNIAGAPVIRKKQIVIPTHKNRNLRRLIGNLSSSIRKMHTGYAQTVSMYSSYVIDPVLWMWIGSDKSYDIVIDMTLSTFIIRNNISKPNSKSGISNSKSSTNNTKIQSLLISQQCDDGVCFPHFPKSAYASGQWPKPNNLVTSQTSRSLKAASIITPNNYTPELFITYADTTQASDPTKLDPSHDLTNVHTRSQTPVPNNNSQSFIQNNNSQSFIQNNNNRSFIQNNNNRSFIQNNNEREINNTSNGYLHSSSLIGENINFINPYDYLYDN
ncbi:Caspase [uncultured virus]|nr:Caspase [uncultured virus]